MGPYSEFADVDRIFWEYLRLREKLASPAPRQTVAETGLVFGQHCKECRAPVREACLEERCRKTGASRYRCTHCQAIWPVDVAFLLRNEFQDSRTSNATDLYHRLALYSRLLNTLTVRERRVYLLLFLYEGLSSYEEVAKEMQRRFPRSLPPSGARGPRPAAWSEWAVRRTIHDARRRLRDNAQAHAVPTPR